MVKKNEDGSFRITSLGVDVPDLDALRAVIRELNDFNGSADFKQEALKKEKDSRNFDKWRKTHLRKLRKEFQGLDMKRAVFERSPESLEEAYTEQDAENFSRLNVEYESLKESTLVPVLNKELSGNDAFWRVRLIELYGSKEDKESLVN